MSIGCALATWALAVPAAADVAGGAETKDNSAEERRIVVAMPEASTGLPAQELVAALRAQLSELDVAVELSSQPFEASGEVSQGDVARDSALAFVWLDREGENLSVHFFEAAGATLRQRRLPLRGTDAVSLEEVAIVVRSAVSALLEREEEREEENEAPLPAPPQPTRTMEEPPASVSRPADAAPRLWVALGWSGQSYAPVLPFSHGASVFGGVRPTSGRWGIGLGYSFLPAQVSARDGISVELSRHPLEAFFRIDSGSESAAFSFGGEAGLLVDWVTRRSESTGVAFVETPDETRASWAATARAHLAVRLFARLHLEVQGGGDFVLSRVSTELEGGETLIEPRWLRPRLLVQIHWDFP